MANPSTLMGHGIADMAAALVGNGYDQEIALITKPGSPFYSVSADVILAEGVGWLDWAWKWFEEKCPLMLELTSRFASKHKLEKKSTRSQILSAVAILARIKKRTCK